jgi:hypothetical protein
MDHATAIRPLLATPFATSLVPLTVRLIPVITQIGRLIVQFRRADLTPQACYHFETQLHDQLRELGRTPISAAGKIIKPSGGGRLPLPGISLFRCPRSLIVFPA